MTRTTSEYLTSEDMSGEIHSNSLAARALGQTEACASCGASGTGQDGDQRCRTTWSKLHQRLEAGAAALAALYSEGEAVPTTVSSLLRAERVQPRRRLALRKTEWDRTKDFFLTAGESLSDRVKEECKKSQSSATILAAKGRCIA
eukprot:203906-Amphidinium_carterae.3